MAIPDADFRTTEKTLAAHLGECTEHRKAVDSQLENIRCQIRGSNEATQKLILENRTTASERMAEQRRRESWGFSILFTLLSILMLGAVAGNPFLIAIRALFGS